MPGHALRHCLRSRSSSLGTQRKSHWSCFMKALVVNALGGRFEPDDVEIAAPIGREVLVDVQASGLCHTDVLFATNNIIPMPAVLGHEVAGIVAEVGPDVQQFKVGDHVVGS